jgi:hypothetical protein
MLAEGMIHEIGPNMRSRINTPYLDRHASAKSSSGHGVLTLIGQICEHYRDIEYRGSASIPDKPDQIMTGTCWVHARTFRIFYR